MKKNININQEEQTVTIEVSVNKRNYVREPVISFRTKDIILLLEKEGIAVNTCIENDTIFNDGRNPKTEGKWVFKLKESKKPKAKKPIVKESKLQADSKNNLTSNPKTTIIDKKKKKRK
tara:strand:+ start:972 stop:1328 length:357 start_codon:yes stop_codon:yes gene_type:complete